MILLSLNAIISITSFILTLLSALLLLFSFFTSLSRPRTCCERKRAALFPQLIESLKSCWQKNKCDSLNRELMHIVRDRDTARRLVMSAKTNYPGKAEEWYLEKVIYDLRRGR